MMRQDKRPNIVLIMSDQHNAGILGSAGNDIVRTPNLDNLAKEGVMFDNAYCPAPLCVPARMGFMTGRHPSDVEVWNNTSRLATTTPTFAHSLGAGGYEAVLSGRMHFSGYDQFHGFEKRLHGDCWHYLSPEMIFVNGHRNNATTGQTRSAVEVSGEGETGYQLYDKVITDISCDYINNRKNTERPYCIVVSYMLPHNPYIAGKELFEYYLAKLPVPEIADNDSRETLHPFVKRWRELRKVNQLVPEQHHRALAAYYALIEEMDQNIGRVINSVKESENADNTIIIYTSDHGDMASEQNGMWWKTCFFEGAARIPMIISDPGSSIKNTRVNSIVNLIDSTATILDYAECKPLPDMSGKSLRQFVVDDEKKVHWKWDQETFSELFGAFGEKPSCMLRKGNWKLIYYSEYDSCQLFNIDEDRAEINDLANLPEYKGIVDDMLSNIHARWSAERMIEGDRKEKLDRSVIESCGHDLFPHEISDIAAPEGTNKFNYSQIPFSESVLSRIER